MPVVAVVVTEHVISFTRKDGSAGWGTTEIIWRFIIKSMERLYRSNIRSIHLTVRSFLCIILSPCRLLLGVP